MVIIFTDFFGTKACDFIQRQKDGPFFLYLACWELYDLSRDPAELNDLATEFPDKVNELAADFIAWQKPMPKSVSLDVVAESQPKAK